jgi:Fur family transcriptional regulator, peroxide stress response regulator
LGNYSKNIDFLFSCSFKLRTFVIISNKDNLQLNNAMLKTHNYLRQFSIKPSVQRSAVMDFLLKNRTHPTIDEIYSALSPMMPTLSKTTVYNTLDLFVERGAVRALAIDEKNARYDVDISAHAHFLCRNCGAICDIFDLKPTLFQLPETSKLKIDSVEISYFGICESCGTN